MRAIPAALLCVITMAPVAWSAVRGALRAPPQVGSAATLPLDPRAGSAGDTVARRDAFPLSRHNVYFTRAQYTSNGRQRGFKDWSTDFPKAERQFLVVLRRLVRLDAYEGEHALRLDDPMLHSYPFLYAVEPGQMQLREAEVAGLRRYLMAGGFLIVDDFWGSREWDSFAEQMQRVFPEYSIRDIPLDHPIFHTVYDIGEVLQVPNVGNGVAGGPTHEQDGLEAHVRGIFDHEGRLMVAIFWNTDLGDAWEWAEEPRYPLKFSTYAYQMGANVVVYAMSH